MKKIFLAIYLTAVTTSITHAETKSENLINTWKSREGIYNCVSSTYRSSEDKTRNPDIINELEAIPCGLCTKTAKLSVIDSSSYGYKMKTLRISDNNRTDDAGSTEVLLEKYKYKSFDSIADVRRLDHIKYSVWVAEPWMTRTTGIRYKKTDSDEYITILDKQGFGFKATCTYKKINK